jgi:hypothetical protein
MAARSEAEIKGIMSQCPPHMDKFYASGKATLVIGLAAEATVLRRENGKIVVTDGPYMETKELLGSTFLIEADDLDDAVRVASLHPTVQVAAGSELGWRIEIRPLNYYQEG